MSPKRIVHVPTKKAATSRQPQTRAVAANQPYDAWADFDQDDSLADIINIMSIMSTTHQSAS